MSSTTFDGPGCVIVMVDESAAMDAPVQDDQHLGFGQQAKPKGDAVATAINALFKQLTAGPDFEVALLGYSTNPNGEAMAVSRWDGALAGRNFVPLSEIAQHPLVVEKRVRKIPDPGNFTGFREEPVEFPVWYVSRRSGAAPQVAAFQHCRQLLTNWLATASLNPGTPLVVNVFGAGSGDGNPLKAIEEIRQLTTPSGAPLVFQAHLAASSLVPATPYSSSRTFLPVGSMRDVFDRSSLLPVDLVSALKATKTPVSANARGMVCNARMPDIVKFLSLVKAHTKLWPSRNVAPASTAPPGAGVAASVTVAPVAETVSASVVSEIPAGPAHDTTAESDDLLAPTVRGGLEQAALVVVVLDRSLANPYAGDTRNACTRLQDHANDLLAKISKTATGLVDVVVVSYGQDATGEVEVRTTFEGALTGRGIVRDTELASGALRVEEIEQQVPNGVGGLMAIPIKKAIFIELEPTPSPSPVPAFRAVRGLLDEWSGQHPSSCVPPVVVHLTPGCHALDEVEAAAAQVVELSGPAGNAVLYHLVATEQPHPSLSYIDGDGDLQTPELKKLWAVSSLLLGRDRLSVDKPALVKPESRGFVVNGKFDLLMDAINGALSQ